MPKISQEDLLLYLYNEIPIEKATFIKAALQNNWVLKERYQELVSAKKQLNCAPLNPEKKTLDNILKYAERAITEEIITSA